MVIRILVTGVPNSLQYYHVCMCSTCGLVLLDPNTIYMYSDIFVVDKYLIWHYFSLCISVKPNCETGKPGWQTGFCFLGRPSSTSFSTQLLHTHHSKSFKLLSTPSALFQTLIAKVSTACDQMHIHECPMAQYYMPFLSVTNMYTCMYIAREDPSLKASH